MLVKDELEDMCRKVAVKPVIGLGGQVQLDTLWFVRRSR